MHLTQLRDQWQILLHTIMNIHKKEDISWLADTNNTSVFQSDRNSEKVRRKERLSLWILGAGDIKLNTQLKYNHSNLKKGADNYPHKVK
jgi:hypothetical protein